MVSSRHDRTEILKRARAAAGRRRSRQIALSWILAALICLGAILLANTDRLLFRQTIVSGASALSPEEIRVAVEETLAGKYFLLIPRRNILFLPQKDIIAELSVKFPSLEQISLTRRGNDLLVNVKERVSEYLWCGEPDRHCYLLDRNGFAYAAAPDFSGHPFFELIGQLPPAPIGAWPLTPEEFARLLKLRAGLAKILSVSVLATAPDIVKLDYPSDYTFQINPTMTSDHSIALITSRSLAEEETLIALATALAAPAFIKEYQTKTAAGFPLEYLDLRFPGQVFYKFST